jgi:ABC-type sugar transport system ATPase subunit
LAEVELRELTKVYPGQRPALERMSLAVRNGEFLVVVGPSGSGKSTLLRIVAGLETPDDGSVWIGGRRVDGLPPHRRDVAMVFQTPALYPHLTARDNMAFGLRARGVGIAEARTQVEPIAARLGLVSLLDRHPRALSGGERQRVALGRAIARQAGVLLLDEPLSSLDAPLRVAMRADLAEFHRHSASTMVLVTHDQAEAMALGDRIAVLHEGRLVQIGTPQEVYRRPATRFVAEFIGSPPMNLLPCEVETGAGGLRLRIAGAEVDVGHTIPWADVLGKRGGGPIDLGLRAEDIHVASRGDSPATGPGVALDTVVSRLEPLGHQTLATLAVARSQRLTIRLPQDAAVRVQDPLSVRLNLARAVWFDPATGRLLD